MGQIQEAPEEVKQVTKGHALLKTIGWTEGSICVMYISIDSQRTLTMFVGVVALRYQHHTTECHNSHMHSQSPWTNQ